MSFYIINNIRFDDNHFAYGEEKGEIKTGDAIYCKECGTPLTMLEWLPPYEIKVSKKVLGDFIFGTFTHFIVSAKFKELYEQHKMSGIKSFSPVKIYYKGKLLDNEYYYPKIVLSNAKVDLVKSRLKFEGYEECDTCQKAGRVIKDMKGLCFENDDSIKEDIFFTIMLPGDVLVSERFKSLLIGLTNLFLTEASEFKPSWIL